MSTILKIVVASFLVTGASLAHAHTGAGDIRADLQVKKELVGDQVAQFRGQVFRGGRGLPPSPCRGRCSR
jgi:hypothetical protein